MDWILTETGDMSKYSPEQLCVIFSMIIQNHKDSLKLYEARGIPEKAILYLKTSFTANISMIIDDTTESLLKQGSKYLS